MGMPQIARIALSAIFLFAGISVSRGDTLTIEQYSFEFDAGKNFCRLDRAASPFEKNLLDWQSKAQAGKNIVLAMYLPCGKLLRGRELGAAGYKRWGMLLATQYKGRFVRTNKWTRDHLLREMEKVLNKGVPLDLKDVTERLNRAMPAEIERRIGKVGAGGFQMLGLLDRDQAAVYSGAVMDITSGGQKATIAGVFSITSLGGYSISYNLYTEFNNRETISGLVEESKRVMNALIANN